jgi:hypothetical protein
MLYQLALYALGQGGPTRRAAILYPTMETTAREQTIVVQEPVGGASQAEVVMRPVKLLELDELVRDRGSHAGRRRGAYAAQLAFGDEKVMKDTGGVGTGTWDRRSGISR